MKKIVILFTIMLVIFSYNKKNTINVFSYTKEEIYDNYYIKFKDCDLNTNNFIEKMSYLKQYDFKILKIIPYNNLNTSYLFYTNDLDYIINNFKNKYINLMINESKYTTNICIQEIKINTSNYILNELKDIINFTY